MFLSEWCEFPSVPCLAGKKKFVDSLCLDVVEITRVPDMLPSLFPSWSGSGLISTPVSIDVTCNLCPFKVSHIYASPIPQIFLSHPCDSPNLQQSYLHYLVPTAVNSHVRWHLGLPTDKSECNFA